MSIHEQPITITEKAIAMQKEQKPISVDTSNKEDAQKIVPNQQLLTSHEAGWKNLIFEHHRQPVHTMPTVCFKQHILAIQLKKIFCERKIDDCLEVEKAQIGDVLIIPANAEHWCRDHDETEFIVLSIEPHQLLQSNQELFKGYNIELIPTFSTPDPFIYGVALALKQELETNYQNSRLYAESLFNSLAFHLLYKYATQKPNIKEYNYGLAPSKLKQVLNLIGDCISEEIKLEQMANHLNMSPFYFCRQFKKSMGLTPYQYIVQQRMKLAKQLLKQQELPISEIAIRCGFASQSSFTTAFRKYVGITPKTYRQQF